MSVRTALSSSSLPGAACNFATIVIIVVSFCVSADSTWRRVRWHVAAPVDTIQRDAQTDADITSKTTRRRRGEGAHQRPPSFVSRLVFASLALFAGRLPLAAQRGRLRTPGAERL